MSRSQFAAFGIRLARYTSLAAALFMVTIAFTGTAQAVDLPCPAPEIDPASMGTALSILAGGVLMLKDSIRRSK